jgi:hypothetical protein
MAYLSPPLLPPTYKILGPALNIPYNKCQEFSSGDRAPICPPPIAQAVPPAATPEWTIASYSSADIAANCGWLARVELDQNLRR